MLRLVMLDEKGEQVSLRHLRLTGEDLKAEEYLTGRLAKEMYRDAMFAKGKWPCSGT